MIKAYAKVNLHLEVGESLNNGYHNLHMINARLKDLYDEIEINEDKINSVDYSNKDLLSNNICLKMLNDAVEFYQIKKRYQVFIKKNIPLGSGLGGGSMDVATIYQFLLKDNHLDISLNEQINFLKKYGADTPYGLFKSIALVEGIGEKITPLDLKFKHKIILCLPNIQVSTKDVFNNFKIKKDIYNKERLFKNLITDNLKELLVNDLEESTFELYPKLKELKDKLSEFGNCLMSGSGSTLFIVNDKPDIKEIREIFADFCFIESKVL